MPPREQPNPPGKNRRRPDVMPGGWLWLVLLILLVLGLLVMVGFPNATMIEYSEFEDLARQGHKKDKDEPNFIIKKVTIIGTDRLEGELRTEGYTLDPETQIGKKLRGRTKFTALIPPTEVQKGLSDLIKETHIHQAAADNSGAWFQQ